MSDLPFQIERYIVKQLACEEAPDTIAEDVQSQFLREVSPRQVELYHPDVDADVLTPGLRDLYRQTRQDVRGEVGKDEERTFVDVASTDVFDDRSMYGVEEDGTAIALIEMGNQYFALANRCTHQGGPLCEGELSEGTVECPWHGAKFDVESGAPTTPPASEGVETFEVRVQGDAIEVKL